MVYLLKKKRRKHPSSQKNGQFETSIAIFGLWIMRDTHWVRGAPLPDALENRSRIKRVAGGAKRKSFRDVLTPWPRYCANVYIWWMMMWYLPKYFFSRKTLRNQVAEVKVVLCGTVRLHYVVTKSLMISTAFWSHTSYESRFLVSTFKGVGKSGVFFSDTRNCSNVGSVRSRTTNGRGKGPSQEFECILESLASNGCLSFLCLVMALRNMADTKNQNQLVFFQRVCWIIHNPSCVAAAHSEERVPLQLLLPEPLQSNLWQQQGIQYPVSPSLSLSPKVWKNLKLLHQISNNRPEGGGGSPANDVANGKCTKSSTVDFCWCQPFVSSQWIYSCNADTEVS